MSLISYQVRMTAVNCMGVWFKWVQILITHRETSLKENINVIKINKYSRKACYKISLCAEHVSSVYLITIQFYPLKDNIPMGLTKNIKIKMNKIPPGLQTHIKKTKWIYLEQRNNQQII